MHLLGCAGAQPAPQAAPSTPAPPAVTALVIGSAQGCAVRGGALYCWPMDARQRRAAVVAGMERDVTDVTSAGERLCAIRAGAALCWEEGQAPAPVAGLERDVTDITLGRDHGCAVKAGALYCWGDNHQGQLGSLRSPPRGPTIVAGLEAGVTEVAAVEPHTYAIKDGALYVFGMYYNAPTHVPELGDKLEQLSKEGYTGCARSAGALVCWDESLPSGGDRWGWSHQGATLERRPVKLRPPKPAPPAYEGRATLMAFGAEWQSCGSDGERIWCSIFWHQHDPDPPQTRVIERLGALERVWGDVEEGCGTRDGALWCWSEHFYGPTLKVEGLPAPVTAMARGIALAAGGLYQITMPAQETPRPYATPVPGFTSGVEALELLGGRLCVTRDGLRGCWPAQPIASGLPLEPHSSSAPPRDLPTHCEARADGVWCSGERPIALEETTSFYKRAHDAPWRIDGISPPATHVQTSHDSGCAVDAEGVKRWGVGWSPAHREYGSINLKSVPPYEPQPWHERAFLISGIEGEVTALLCRKYMQCAATTRGVYCSGRGDSSTGGVNKTAGSSAYKLEGMPGGALGFVSAEHGICVLGGDRRVWCHAQLDGSGHDAPAEVALP